MVKKRKKTHIVPKKTTATKNPTTPHILKKKKAQNYHFVFNKEKYIIMLVGLGFIILGFLLMVGGGSDDPYKFSEEIFSDRRITLAPILVLLGFAIEIYAIMKTDKNDKPKDAVLNEEKND